jgi:hypothetical protein
MSEINSVQRLQFKLNLLITFNSHIPTRHRYMVHLEVSQAGLHPVQSARTLTDFADQRNHIHQAEVHAHSTGHSCNGKNIQRLENSQNCRCSAQEMSLKKKIITGNLSRLTEFA